MIKKIWESKVEEAFKLRESGSKKISDWKLLQLIIFKYDLPVELRGIGAYEGAIKIVKDKDSWEKLDKKEKEFVANLTGGTKK